MAKGSHQHRRCKGAGIGDAVPVPPVGIPRLQTWCRRGVEQRQEVAIVHPAGTSTTSAPVSKLTGCSTARAMIDR